MRRYEVTCVLAPTLSAEEVEQAIENFKKIAEGKGAEVANIDNWGKKRLAFPVKKHKEGYYVIYTLDEPSGAASTEMERRFKVTESVIRFLTVRIDEDLQRAEKLKSQRDLKKSRRKAASAAAAQALSSKASEAAKKEASAAAGDSAPKAPAESAEAEAAPADETPTEEES